MAATVVEGMAVGVAATVVEGVAVGGSVASGVAVGVGESPPQATSATAKVVRRRKRATTAFTPQG